MAHRSDHSNFRGMVLVVVVGLGGGGGDQGERYP